MGDFFIFRSDMHPFPGGAGIELISIWIWRSLLWIAGGLAACAAVDAATERVRHVGRGWIRLLGPALLFAICLPGLAIVAWLVFIRSPNREFIVQWNRMLSIPEIGFLSLLSLALAWGVHRKFPLPRWRFLRWTVWVLAVAVALVVVSTLGWKVIVHRGVGIAFAELLLSLVLFAFLLARSCRAVWRWRSWKSAFPMAAWFLALGCVVLGWIAWFGLGEMVLTSCA